MSPRSSVPTILNNRYSFFARIRRDEIVAVMVAQPLLPLAAPTTANQLLSYVKS